MKPSKDWFVDCPWGKVALVSWGDPSKIPILLVHGYLDSAATFIPIIELLPDDYYYVGVDLPGHGKSDPMPPGIPPQQSHLVEVVKIAVANLNWDKFIYLSHSMAFFVGLYYNAIFPGQIMCMINIDANQALGAHIGSLNLPIVYSWISNYFENYEEFNKIYKITTKERAIQTVVNRRGVSEEQAEILLTRMLVPIGDGKYKMMLDNKMKRITYLQVPKETIKHMMIAKQPHMLHISAVDNKHDTSKMGQEFLQEFQDMNKNILSVFLTGGHDCHITNPDAVASCIKQYLERDFNVFRLNCKL